MHGRTGTRGARYLVPTTSRRALALAHFTSGCGRNCKRCRKLAHQLVPHYVTHFVRPARAVYATCRTSFQTFWTKTYGNPLCKMWMLLASTRVIYSCARGAYSNKGTWTGSTPSWLLAATRRCHGEKIYPSCAKWSAYQIQLLTDTHEKLGIETVDSGDALLCFGARRA